MEHIKLMYCPAHKGIKENEIAANLVETASEESSHLPPEADISLSKVKEINRQIPLDKWHKTWENTNFHKSKQPILYIKLPIQDWQALPLYYQCTMFLTKYLSIMIGTINY